MLCLGFQRVGSIVCSLWTLALLKDNLANLEKVVTELGVKGPIHCSSTICSFKLLVS